MCQIMIIRSAIMVDIRHDCKGLKLEGWLFVSCCPSKKLSFPLRMLSFPIFGTVDNEISRLLSVTFSEFKRFRGIFVVSSDILVKSVIVLVVVLIVVRVD